MIRSFLPVGQGAFYTEQFNSGDNVVYDCGSSTGVDYVNNMIKSTFAEKETISMVFISHLHSDHINGLECLIKHCVVEKIYVPYLYPDEVEISICVQRLTKPKESEFVHEFIRNPERAVARLCEQFNTKHPRIVYVFPDAEDGDYKNIEQRCADAHFSGIPVHLYETGSKVNWIYIPYNIKNEERKKKFMTELKRVGIDISQYGNIISMLKTKTGQKKLREAYEKVEGGLNTNTMVVYSGPLHNGKTYWQRISNRFGCEYRRCGDYYNSGCLYLGDFDAKSNWDYLDSKYDEYWGRIGVIQLPHHGSQHNYNNKLLSKDVFYIISAGFRNPYNHPHAKVLKELILHHKRFAWITEETGSMIQFEVVK